MVGLRIPASPYLPGTPRIRLPFRLPRPSSQVPGLLLIGQFCYDMQPLRANHCGQPGGGEGGGEAARDEDLRGGRGLWGGAPGPGAEPECVHLDGFTETAVNIGFACKLLSENMLILEDKDIK